MGCRTLFVLSAICAVILCGVVFRADAFVFDLPATRSRCFTEEVHSGTDLRISFTALPGYAQFIDVVLSDHDSVVRWMKNAQDRASYHEFIHSGGDFMLCFFSRMAQGAKYSEGLSRSISVEIRTGNEGDDYAEVATKEKLRPIEVQLRALEDTVRAIHAEYLYYKEKEAEMRNTNEHMTAKVVWLTAGVIVLFVLFFVWELSHLKSYFRKKRLID